MPTCHSTCASSRPRPSAPPPSPRSATRRARTAGIVGALALVLATAAPVRAVDYVQSAGSSLTFATQYQGEVFTGRFPAFSTRLSFDPARLAGARLEVTIPLAGVATANDDRDSTLRGEDFFDVSRYPTARYSATRFRSLGGNRYVADGALSLHGVTRPVTLGFTWTPGAAPVLAGKATVKRLDFGIGGGDWADLSMIPADVAISTRVVFRPAR